MSNAQLATNNKNNSKQSQAKNRRMIPLRNVLIPFAIIFVAIIVVAVAGALAPKPAKKPLLVKAPLVEVISLDAHDVRFNVASQGSVSPRTETTLISEVAGTVTRISDKFLVGSFFKKGELLLTIDDTLYQITLTKAKAKLASAAASLLEEQAKVEQAKQEWQLTGKSLKKAPVLALRTPQLQKAKAELVGAQADVAEAKFKLARTHIIAPYDGMLKEKRADIGQYITIGSQLAVTFAVDYAEVRLPIKKRDLNFLNLTRINQTEQLDRVELYANSAGEKQHWSAHLTRYEGVIDSKSRVYYVVARIDDPYGILTSDQQDEIRIGSFVNANIRGKNFSDVFAIPKDIVAGSNVLYWLDQQSDLQIIHISVLRSDANFVYTQDQQLAGKRLIVTNIETPVAGMKLRLANEQPQDEKQGENK